MKALHALAFLAAGAALALALAAADAASPPDPPPLPELLSGTGLFVPGSVERVQADVIEFSPQYPLWSDATEKRRWLRLPPGAFVDASDPDAWVFPPGTRLWKQFALGGRRLETRLIERLADGSWRYATYVWDADGRDARLAPATGAAALTVAGRDAPYPIPSETDCRACHEGAPVPVLGFSALQLSPDRDPLAPHAGPAVPEADLRALVARGVVRNLPPSLLESPPRIAARSPVERAALGYLHGNCGQYHSRPDAAGAGVPVDVRLAQSVVDPASARQVLDSLVRAPSRFRPHGTDAARVVQPGHPDASVLALRMRSRDPRTQMPPLGSTLTDAEGLALIERWIAHDLPRNESLTP